MGNTFTSWSGLVLALQQEVAEATAEVIDASMDDLFMNIDQFYSSSEGRYTRTGTLRMSPESEFSGGGSVSSGEIRLNTGHRYSPSGRLFITMLRMEGCLVMEDSGHGRWIRFPGTYRNLSAAGFPDFGTEN